MSIFDGKSVNETTQIMIDVYENWPKYAQESYDNAKPISVKFEKIVFCGMGGSGLVFDILSSLILDKPVIINKGYVLPKNISNSLMIFNSASGDTIETLTALKSALKTKNKIIAFSSGGKLENFCKKNKITHIKYNMQSSPRASLPVSLYTILGTLSDSFGIKKSMITKSIKSLHDAKKKYLRTLILILPLIWQNLLKMVRYVITLLNCSLWHYDFHKIFRRIVKNLQHKEM